MPFPYARTLVPAMLAVAASFSAALWLTQSRMGPVDGEARLLVTDVTPTLRTLDVARGQLEDLDAAAEDFVVACEEGGRGAAAARRRVETEHRHFEAALATYLSIPFLPDEVKVFAPLGETVAQLDVAMGHLLDAGDRADATDARALLTDEVNPVTARAFAQIDGIVDYDLDLADHQLASIEDASGGAEKVATVLGVGSLSLSVIATILASRGLAREADQERARIRERALREAAELEVRRRDEFLAVASHEMRTPVTSLLLASQMLAARPDHAQRALASIERQARRIGALADALVDVSRMGEGPLPLDRADVELGEVVRVAVARLGSTIETAGCPLEVHVPEAVRGRWDRARLEQVVASLVSNAVKFGAGKPVSVAVARDGHLARLTVRDAGPGIPPERLPHLFERFARGVSADHYGGLGLGLFVARRVVEAHGGRIVVASERGRGTTFDVELPAG